MAENLLGQLRLMQGVTSYTTSYTTAAREKRTHYGACTGCGRTLELKKD